MFGVSELSEAAIVAVTRVCPVVSVGVRHHPQAEWSLQSSLENAVNDRIVCSCDTHTHTHSIRAPHAIELTWMLWTVVGLWLAQPLLFISPQRDCKPNLSEKQWQAGIMGSMSKIKESRFDDPLWSWV